MAGSETRCACGRPTCHAVLTLDADDEAQLREHADWLPMHPGHALASDEAVVRKPDVWLVRRGDDPDEASVESFPASDPPAGRWER